MNENKAVKTVGLIISATLISKILGFVRQSFLAASYGDGGAPFLTALRITQDSFELFLGAAVLGVFIPVYNSFSADKNKEKEEFANIFLNTALALTIIIAVIGIIFSRRIVGFITGFTAETADITASLLQILFPMIIFMGAVYTLIGVLQSKGEFLAPALVSAVSNCAIIIYFIFFDKYFGLTGLSAVFVLSWLIQLLTLAVPLARKKYKYKFIINLKNPALIESVKRAAPIIAGAWLIPVGMLIGIHFASLFEDGEFYVTAFNYSTILFLLATGILTHGVCNYIFPKLSQNADDERVFAEILKNGLSGLVFIIAPVACMAYILRGEAVAVLFMRGKFTPELAAETAGMFAVFAPAMVMFSGVEFLNRVFYSKNLVKIPMFTAVLGVSVNFGLCYVFIHILGLGPVYISAANLICQTAAAAVLSGMLKIKVPGVFTKNFLANTAKIALSSGISLVGAEILHFLLKNNAFESGLFKNIITAGAVFIAGIAVYLCANAAFKTNEARIMVKILSGKKNRRG